MYPTGKIACNSFWFEANALNLYPLRLRVILLSTNSKQLYLFLISAFVFQIFWVFFLPNLGGWGIDVISYRLLADPFCMLATRWASVALAYFTSIWDPSLGKNTWSQNFGLNHFNKPIWQKLLQHLLRSLLLKPKVVALEAKRNSGTHLWWSSKTIYLPLIRMLGTVPVLRIYISNGSRQLAPLSTELALDLLFATVWRFLIIDSIIWKHIQRRISRLLKQVFQQTSRIFLVLLNALLTEKLPILYSSILSIQY